MAYQFDILYTLTRFPCYTALMVPGTDIRILVYDLASDDFKVNNNVLQLFGFEDDIPPRYFAFEVKGWNPDQLHLVNDTIKWYCTLINMPGIALSMHDPRPGTTMTVVK